MHIAKTIAWYSWYGRYLGRELGCNRLCPSIAVQAFWSVRNDERRYPSVGTRNGGKRMYSGLLGRNHGRCFSAVLITFSAMHGRQRISRP
jgi:hypothetical protein